MNIKIIVTAEVSTGTDLNALRQRVADQLRQIANPVREDQGITVVSNVIVTDGIRTGSPSLGIRTQAHSFVMASESEMEAFQKIDKEE